MSEVGLEPFDMHWVQRPHTQVVRVLRPSSIEQAALALHQDPSRRLVAGGTDLVVELARVSGPALELIDLSRVGGQRFVERRDPDRVGTQAWPRDVPMRHHLVLGSGVTHNQVVTSGEIVDLGLPLAQACLEIGSAQLRNRATVAGNIATASPANDTISALMALGASVRMLRVVSTHSGSGESGSAGPSEVEYRAVPIADFFTGLRETVMGPDELIESIWVPELTANQRGIWVKAGLRKAQAISVVHAGIVVEFDSDDTQAPVADVQIAVGSVAPTVVLAQVAAQALVGQPLDDQSIEACAQAVAASVEPIDDGRATAEYRRSTVVTVVRRALRSIAAGTERDRWPRRIACLVERDTEKTWTETVAGNSALADVDHETEIVVDVNGTRLRGARAASSTLLDWLREHAGTGSKEGCAEGECGACTVMIDGRAAMACLVPASQADQARVTTVEGLADPDSLNRVQQSFVDNFAVQCGYCIPGFVVAATALCDEIQDPTREESELALAGNLCRCTGYYAILEAVRAASSGSGRESVTAVSGP